MGLAALEILDALGIEAAIVPAPPAADANMRWPDALAKKYASDSYVKLVSAGGRSAPQNAPNPQVEQLKSLKPDVIVLDSRSRGLQDQLKSIAPVVELGISNTSLVDSVVQNILTVGAAFGKERQAIEKANALLDDVRAVREAAARQGTGLVLFGVGNRVMPQQIGARFGMLYDVIGIRPVLLPGEGEGLSTGRPSASIPEDADAATKAAAEAARQTQQAAEARYFAEVMARDPKWLFVVDRNAAFGPAKAAEAMAATPVISNSTAWKQNKVIYLDQGGAAWYTMAGSLGLLETSLRRIKAEFEKHEGR